MDSKKLHPLIPEAREELRKGTVSRRDFIRFATLLGMSVAGAEALAACSPAATPTKAPAAAPTAAAAQVAAEPTKVPPVPTAAMAAAAGGIVRGGILRAATRIERVDHPARFSLVSQSHPWRHVFDYLTQTDTKGITTPYLLDSWKASDDLKTWTLTLKKGIKFNNGKELTADDLLFNFAQWLKKETGSSLKGQMSYLDETGQEKTDNYTVVCHLNKPSIFFPEHLFHYAACILPKEFEGDVTKQPIGTGAFLMKEYVPGERAHLVRREDYWRMGADGKALPYLDEIVMVMLGGDAAANLAALKSGQVDTVIEPAVSVWEGSKDDPRLAVISTPTTATRVLRVRVDQDPWKDNKVRTALKMCHNREKILALALRNQGTIGNDSAVGAAMADYDASVKPLPFDTAKAKQLMTEAGLADGVDVTLTVPSDWPESMAYAQALKEDAAPAGFRIKLNTMPATQYWDGWTEFNMGITWWAHRPLGPMVLDVAYTADKDGKPVTWNESKWVDDEFQKILNQAEATLDVEARRKLMGQMETIQRDRGSICTPFFMNVWGIYDKKFHGIEPSPEEYAIYHEAWKEA